MLLLVWCFTYVVLNDLGLLVILVYLVLPVGLVYMLCLLLGYLG